MGANGLASQFVESLEPRQLLSVLAFAPQQTFAVGVSPQAVASGDFNNDGNADLAFANDTVPGQIDVLLGNGNGTFAPAQSIALGQNATSSATSDFNDDGNTDLAVGEAPGVVAILLGNGNGTFQPAQT